MGFAATSNKGSVKSQVQQVSCSGILLFRQKLSTGPYVLEGKQHVSIPTGIVPALSHGGLKSLRGSIATGTTDAADNTRDSGSNGHELLPGPPRPQVHSALYLPVPQTQPHLPHPPPH